MMTELHKKHIELVEAVNNAATESEHQLNYARLCGFRDALQEIAGTVSYGQMLMNCDMHYMEQGIDRDMCCGVWSDWKPATTEGDQCTGKH